MLVGRYDDEKLCPRHLHVSRRKARWSLNGGVRRRPVLLICVTSHPNERTTDIQLNARDGETSSVSQFKFHLHLLYHMRCHYQISELGRLSCLERAW